MNCWEFLECGREAGGHMADEMGVCPAYPNGGHRCAHVVGTLCGGKPQGRFVDKFLGCVKCPFFHSEHYERNNTQSDGQGESLRIVVPDAASETPPKPPEPTT